MRIKGCFAWPPAIFITASERTKPQKIISCKPSKTWLNPERLTLIFWNPLNNGFLLFFFFWRFELWNRAFCDQIPSLHAQWGSKLFWSRTKLSKIFITAMERTKPQKIISCKPSKTWLNPERLTLIFWNPLNNGFLLFFFFWRFELWNRAFCDQIPSLHAQWGSKLFWSRIV